MAKIKGIIFDLDGTLGNTLPLCIQAFRQSIEPLALRQISDQEIIATFGPSEEGTIQTLIPEHYEQGVVNYLQFYQDLHDICPASFTGIAELISILHQRQFPMAMVTGKGEKSTNITLKKFGLEGFFDPIKTGSPTGPVKPAGIKAVLEAWSHPDPKTIIYVGDAPGDITASRECGIPVVAAAWAETAEPEALKALKPDHIFYTVEAFAGWLLSFI